MAAINYPILYQRDYSRDVPQPITDGTSSNWPQKAIAALPLLALHRSCRVPLSMALSGARVITQMKATLKAVERKDITQAVYQFFHSCLTTAACTTGVMKHFDLCIVSVSEKLGSHVVVVDAVSKDLSTIRLRDPYHGWEISVSSKAFLKEWRGGKAIQVGL